MRLLKNLEGLWHPLPSYHSDAPSPKPHLFNPNTWKNLQFDSLPVSPKKVVKEPVREIHWGGVNSQAAQELTQGCKHSAERFGIKQKPPPCLHLDHREQANAIASMFQINMNKTHILNEQISRETSDPMPTNYTEAPTATSIPARAQADETTESTAKSAPQAASTSTSIPAQAHAHEPVAEKAQPVEQQPITPSSAPQAAATATLIPAPPQADETTESTAKSAPQAASTSTSIPAQAHANEPVAETAQPVEQHQITPSSAPQQSTRSSAPPAHEAVAEKVQPAELQRSIPSNAQQAAPVGTSIPAPAQSRHGTTVKQEPLCDPGSHHQQMPQQETIMQLIAGLQQLVSQNNDNSGNAASLIHQAASLISTKNESDVKQEPKRKANPLPPDQVLHIDLVSDEEPAAPPPRKRLRPATSSPPDDMQSTHLKKEPTTPKPGIKALMKHFGQRSAIRLRRRREAIAPIVNASVEPRPEDVALPATLLARNDAPAKADEDENENEENHQENVQACLMVRDSQWAFLKKERAILMTYNIKPMSISIILSQDQGTRSVLVGHCQVNKTVQLKKGEVPVRLSTGYCKKRLKDGLAVFVWNLSDIQVLTNPMVVKLTSQRYRNRHFFMEKSMLETSWSVDPPASMSLYSTSSFFIRLLSTADYSKLRETAHNLDGYKLRVGTTCSGSDVGIIAIKSVLRAMNKEFGATGCLYTYSNRFHSYHYKICSKYRNHHLIWSLRTL